MTAWRSRYGEFSGNPAISAEPISPAQYKAVEDRAVDELIALQERSGLDIMTDGHVRRSTFLEPLSGALNGVGILPGQGRSRSGGIAVTAKVSRKRSMTVEEFVYLRSRSTKPIKISLPSPLSALGLHVPEYSARAYPDPFDLVRDLSDLIRHECEELAVLGCELIQLDVPLDWLTHSEPRDDARYDIDPERLLADGLEILNATVDVPGVSFILNASVTGTANRAANAGGGFAAIAKAVFERCSRFSGFVFPIRPAQLDDIAALAHCPPDKTITLGLIDVYVDHLAKSGDDLRKLLARASRYLPKENIAVTTHGDLRESSMEQAEKVLGSLVRMADEIVGRDKPARSSRADAGAQTRGR
ncbi:hypothetical protein ACFSCW_06545 [Sphingomonas tabacisoli]|uniref:Cobalamin-independent methionine synthase MetE C-terminal/archaeal domain-containing protein n=1 Tax=Sphingomonas tabacisoli TaxID=2249466 RepID=A0ABW4I1A9_9SPHN